MFGYFDFLKITHQLSIFSGLICILVCLQKSSLVTVTKSHCLHLNVLTFPCELILGTLMPIAKDLKHDCKMNTCNKNGLKYTLIIIQVLRSQVMLIFQMVSVFRLRLGAKFTLSTSENKQKVRIQKVAICLTLHYLVYLNS